MKPTRTSPSRRFLQLSALLIAITSIFSARAQQTYTFTNAGATGQYGPSQNQVNTAYASTNLSGSVTVSSGIQTFTIPISGMYRVTAIGAQGGNSGGLGAQMSGDFNLTAGTVLKILVGQQGLHLSSSEAGGGGGSFVTYTNNVPLVVAGGGGGDAGTTMGIHASITTTGNSGYSAQNGQGGTWSNAYGNGGTGGNGATSGPPALEDPHAGNGGGLLTAGAAGYCGGSGVAFISGGDGGYGCQGGDEGGFGGGGGAGNYGGGGGGGYSGGGGSYHDPTNGGGGGSYNNGTNQVNTASVGIGHGKVILKELCKIAIIPTGVNSSSALCSGSSATLTTDAISNYSWSTGGTTSSIVVSPNTTTVYTLTAMSPSNCITTVSYTLVVNGAPPVLSVTSNTTTTCLGKKVTLNATGAVTHSWSGGVVNGVAFTPTSTTVYTVVGTNGCGSATSSITITVAPLPVGVSASNTLVCQLQPVTLTAAGASSYTWMPGNITSSVMVIAPVANNIYTVTASDGTCVGMATVAINTNPNPTITIAATSSAICGGSSVTLTATGASSYSWANAPITGNSGVVTPTSSTLYQVTGSNQFNCVTGASQVVIIKQTPSIIAKVSNTIVCNGNSSTLSVTGNASTYSWSTGSANSSVVVSPNVTSSYTVTGTDNASGCSSAKVVTVEVFQAILPVSPSATICEGASITLTAGAGTNYQWSPVPSSFPGITVKPLVPTTYSVSATTNNNNLVCLSSNTIHIGINPKPVVTAVSTKTFMCRTRESVTLTAGGAATFLWLNNSSTNASYTFTSNVIQTHNLMVVGTDASGCKDTAVVAVRVDACTGLEESGHSAELFNVYPNPNSGKFVIRSAAAMELKLRNELGQVIAIIHLDGTNDHLAEFNHLAEGIYFVSGTLRGYNLNQKIVVTHK